VDLKAFNERFYRELCKGHLQAVLETLQYLKHETNVWFEITTLLIPGQNDSDGELNELTQWVRDKLGADVPMHFTAFHPAWRMNDILPTPPSTLTRARRIALDNGMRYVYTGNVHDESGASTYCHKCGTRLIGRDWYQLTAWNLDEKGACKKCGEPCAGVFDSRPGNWGGRRMAVHMKDFA
jgi:pyruvate formate lyase activating enzyme